MEMTNRDLLEKIKVNVEQMKRFRPTLRDQVDEVLNGIIAQSLGTSNEELYFKYKGKDFSIEKIETGYYCGSFFTSTGFNYEFLERDNMGIAKCFDTDYLQTDEYTREFECFSNKDIIFLAQNIEGILEKINSCLDSSKECLKSLTEKMDKILNVLKSEEKKQGEM